MDANHQANLPWAESCLSCSKRANMLVPSQLICPGSHPYYPFWVLVSLGKSKSSAHPFPTSLHRFCLPHPTTKGKWFSGSFLLLYIQTCRKANLFLFLTCYCPTQCLNSHHPSCHQGLSFYYIYLCIYVCVYLFVMWAHAMTCIWSQRTNCGNQVTCIYI